LTDLDIQKHLQSTLQQAVLDYLQQTDLDQVISEVLTREVDKAVANIAHNAVTVMLRERNIETEIANWVRNDVAERLLNTAKNTVHVHLTQMDLNAVARNVIYDQIHNRSMDLKFPAASIDPNSINWPMAKLSADVIDHGCYRNFTSTGITDYSTELQLRITDQGLVVERNIVSKNMLVEDKAFINDLTIEKDLEVAGDLILHAQAQQTVSNIVEQVIQKQNSLNLNLDLSNKQITANDQVLLDTDQLGPSVLTSNLRKVGNLVDLSVLGDANIAETFHVSTTGRVGINTYEPTGALTIWDQDAEFTFSKSRNKEMYAGSTRPVNVVLGSNSQSQIRLAEDVVEINNKIRFQGRLFSIGDQIPEHQGEPGEIVLHQNNIYVCQSGNSWQRIC
jgi:hypothetical protein